MRSLANALPLLFVLTVMSVTAYRIDRKERR